MTSEVVSALAERLDEDTSFTAAFEDDPLATLRDEGFAGLATAAEQDRDRIGELVDRIYRDDEFRTRVEEDPLAELIGWGLPEAAVGPLLLVAGAPDEVIDRATADVEAHLSVRKPATVAAVAAVLGTFAFAQQAAAASNPATSSAQASAQLAPQATAQVAPQVTAQVRPQATAQLKPQATAQVKPQARVQVSRTAQAKWHGIQPQRAKALGGLSSLLSINRGL
jgi:hypothetical protein